jgi:hypothetical protein
MIGARIGGKVGARVGVAMGISADELSAAGITVDPVSGKPVPANAAEWTAFLILAAAADAQLVGAPNPTALWLYTEASGNILDRIGSRNLTANVAPSYGAPITGWARLGVEFNGTVNQRCAHTTFADSATTSLYTFLYREAVGIPGATANLFTYGTSSIAGGLTRLATDRIRYRNVAIVDFAAASPGPGPVGYEHNLDVAGAGASPRARAWDLNEKLSPAFNAAAGTRLDIGATSGASDPCRVFYQPLWDGLPAEFWTDARKKALAQQLGWTIPWA